MDKAYLNYLFADARAKSRGPVGLLTRRAMISRDEPIPQHQHSKSVAKAEAETESGRKINLQAKLSLFFASALARRGWKFVETSSCVSSAVSCCCCCCCCKTRHRFASSGQQLRRPANWLPDKSAQNQSRMRWFAPFGSPATEMQMQTRMQSQRNRAANNKLYLVRAQFR